MAASNVLGIIYSNAYDSLISELTSVRTMGSVPFAGRYRLIDFVLSSMVNSGIGKVGVEESEFLALKSQMAASQAENKILRQEIDALKVQLDEQNSLLQQILAKL